MTWPGDLPRGVALLVAAAFCMSPVWPPSPSAELTPLPSATMVEHIAPPATPPAVEPTAPPPRFEATVEASRAAVRIEAVDDPTAIHRIRLVEGVQAVTEVYIGRLTTAAGTTLDVAAVDPVGYRPFSPPVVADTVAVWERIDEGNLAVTPAAADTVAVELGDDAMLGAPNPVAVRLGAIASNGTPPVADALVNRDTGARLGLNQVPRTVLVAVTDDVPAELVADRLRDQGLDASVIPDPRSTTGLQAMAPQGDTVWDLLATCESSSNWAANTGNGYYGGLQFLPESWWLVGGVGLPHEASREEQILRAELLLEHQGWEAWPVCSVRVGLRPPP